MATPAGARRARERPQLERDRGERSTPTPPKHSSGSTPIHPSPTADGPITIDIFVPANLMAGYT